MSQLWLLLKYNIIHCICSMEDGTMKEVEVQHIVNLTMIDGKIQTIISTATNSYQCCSVCGVSPIEMNNLS